MGSYSNLYIDNYPILTAKNDYYEDVIEAIFLPSDYCEYERPLNQRNKITWGDAYVNEEGNEIIKSFSSTAKICKDRLELFGITVDKAKHNFELAILKMKEYEVLSFLEDDQPSYDEYLKTIKKVINSGIKIYYESSTSSFEHYLNENELFVEEQSIILGLWSILSVLPDDAKIEYDLTDVINGGWINDKPYETIQTEKIIVLTEGKTDTEFIKIGLRFFFPHLEGYYHFIDFENSRYEASASRLVHTIKSFVGSGIKSLIIAIFDNDAAASKEINGLSKVKLPPNIKVLQYPEIEWAKSYPSIGPTGLQKMDINGLAGSIEMYLGKDCLQANGGYIPIQWTGYVDSIKKYQGVLLKKTEIQKKFRKKVKDFDKSRFELDNWKELISIIDLMNNTWK